MSDLAQIQKTLADPTKTKAILDKNKSIHLPE